MADLEMALELGIDWSLREGYAWAEDKEHCEEFGRMLNADPSKVTARAKKRGLPQVCGSRFVHESNRIELRLTRAPPGV